MGLSCRKQKKELIAPCTYDLHGDPTPHDDTMFLLERLVQDARGRSEWLWFLLASLQGSFQHRELHFMVWRKPVCAIEKAETKKFD
jgi:hypothetical protein